MPLTPGPQAPDSRPPGPGSSFAPPRRTTVLDERSGRPALQAPKIRILHTSDWHLGRSINRVRRDREFREFLEWLLRLLERESVDALLVAGDVFDSTSPPVWAQELYYSFLARASPRLKALVVTSGNHDSASFLEAPRELLKYFNIRVFAAARENPAEELVVLEARDGSGPAAIVAAVPFLPERDVRLTGEAETSQVEGRGIIKGIADRYRRTAEAAAALSAKTGALLPVIAMGHLMAAGAVYAEGDGMRVLYPGYAPEPCVDGAGSGEPGGETGRKAAAEASGPSGSSAPAAGGPLPQAAAGGPRDNRMFTVGALWGVDASLFAGLFDYAALGHIHRPQQAGAPNVRYSGSPIPMRFSESAAAKSVTLIEIGGGALRAETLEVPVFRELRRLEGDLDLIAAGLRELASAGSDALVEVIYTGPRLGPELKAEVDRLSEGKGFEVTAVMNLSAAADARQRLAAPKALETMSEEEIFDMVLKRYREKESESWPALRTAHAEVLLEVRRGEAEDRPRAGLSQEAGRSGPAAPGGGGAWAGPAGSSLDHDPAGSSRVHERVGSFRDRGRAGGSFRDRGRAGGSFRDRGRAGGSPRDRGRAGGNA
ncbi:MAG: exonuclease SbcCD subunit D C-terminal domain-containing protein [Deltaproteobacteria bacterium]|jgi:exonuclease SbcD|nr:exonuclease SbcCD subunit D C-terminal domain-containing protein [Deltaproteobacteria bacterium]